MHPHQTGDERETLSQDFAFGAEDAQTGTVGDEVGQSNMVRSFLVKVTRINFTVNFRFHIRDFFWPFIN